MGTSESKRNDGYINSKYICYIRNEKEKFMESANAGNSANSNVCSELLSYCHGGPGDNLRSAWRDHLQRELLRLRGNHEWACSLLDIMKKFGPFSELKYINEVNWLNFKFGIFEKAQRILPNAALASSRKLRRPSNQVSVDKGSDGLREDSAPTFLQKDECSLNIDSKCLAQEVIEKNFEELTIRDLQPEKVSELIQKMPIIEADIKSSWTQGCKPSSSIKVPNYFFPEGQEREPQERIELIKSILEDLTAGKNPSVFSEQVKNDRSRSEYLNCLQKSLLDYRNNDAISLLVHEEKTKREMRHYLAHFKKVVMLLFNHFRDEKHLFSHLIKGFKSYYLKKYGEEKQPCEKATEKDLCHGICDIQEFTKLMQETLNIFYKFGSYKEALKEKCLFTKENVMNFLISFIIDKDIYLAIMRVQRSLDSCFEARLAEKYKRFENEEPWPEDFGVKNEFSLTMSTLDVLRERQEKCDFVYLDAAKGDLNQTPDRIKSHEQLNEFFNTLKLDSYRLNSCIEHKPQPNSHAGVQTNFSNPLPNKKAPPRTWATKDCPFQSAIDELKKIDRFCCPVMKIKTALACSEEIVCCIRRFYSQQGVAFNATDLTAEDVLSILLFVVARARIPTLHSQCTFISKFINNRTSCSIAGYYLTTLQACLLYLSDE